MKNKLKLRLPNELGNQMFMYASALGISKKLNRSLLIDNETAYLSKKNISRYGLNNFKITSNNDFLLFKKFQEINHANII